MRTLLAVLFAAPMLGGCVSAVKTVVTAPVKAQAKEVKTARSSSALTANKTN